MSLEQLLDDELARFEREHPRSRALAEQAKATLLGGVPMHWMVRWPGGFPVFAVEAHGARFRDADGLEYVDFCLGDTGAMAGHSPEPTVRAVAEQARRGITLMLPSEDALAVGAELARRFGLPRWQFALTATDANRFAIRLARHITGRPKVLVFNWCYHGTVDESFATLDERGPRRRARRQPRAAGAARRDDARRRVERRRGARARARPRRRRVRARGAGADEHRHRPAGARLPRRPARRRPASTAPLLIIDETHTLCAGPGGYTGAHGLEPDVLTVGKSIGGGIACAAYGFSDEVATRIEGAIPREESDVGGIGGTLAANVLSLAAMRATLGEVLTDDAFAHMIELGERFEAGVQAVDRRARAPVARDAARLPRRVSLPRASGRATAARPRPAATRCSTGSSISGR